MPRSRIAASSCLISNGCSFKTWEAVNRSFHHWTGRYHTNPVDSSCFLTFVAVLDWAVTHQSDPFPCPYSTGPQWIRRPREAPAKDPSSMSPRAAVDTEDADTVDGEVATERIVPVPNLGLPPKLAAGPSSRPKEVDRVCHRLVLGVFLGHQNHSLNFHLLYGWYSATLQGRRPRCGTL